MANVGLTTRGVASRINGGLVISGNVLPGSATADYGVALVGNSFRSSVSCTGKRPGRNQLRCIERSIGGARQQMRRALMAAT